MPVTVKEIAEYANVSRGTVDRALHGREGVHPEVRKRILALAESMGYRPNTAAKALSNLKKKVLVGLLLPSVENPFFLELIQGAKDAQKDFADYGVELIVSEMRGYDINEQINRISELVDSKIDMLALTPFNDDRVAAKINEITQSGIKVFTVNSDIDDSERVGYIGIDFMKSGSLAAGLIGLINRRANVLIVNGSLRLKSHGQRIQGFLETVQERFPMIHISGNVICNDNAFEAHDKVREALQKNQDIDMIYIVGEGITGVCAAISEVKDRNIDVVCFDDVPHTRELFREGKISATICQQPHRQGYRALQQCFNCFMGTAKKQKSILLENIIKIRESF